MTDNPSLIESAGGNKADVISEAPKERKRAESLITFDAVAEPELLEFHREGDRIWLTNARPGGAREILCEVSVGRAALLNKQLAEIVWALAGR